MNNLKILEYKLERNKLFNQCFDEFDTFLDEETKEIVYHGKGFLVESKVIEKINPLDEYFRNYCKNKLLCFYDNYNPKLSTFYKIFDLKYFGNKQYPQLILNRISTNMGVSKNYTKKTMFIDECFFIEKEEILQITGWYESKNIGFDKRYLYVLKNELGRYKIGVSIDVEKRVKALEISSGSKIEIIFKFNSRGDFENKLHRHFKEKRYLGEWFSLNESDLEFIKKIDFSKPFNN